MKKIGWRSFSTPAISKAAKETGSLDTDAPEGPTGKFHNSGGELVLLRLTCKPQDIIKSPKHQAIDLSLSDSKVGPCIFLLSTLIPTSAWRMVQIVKGPWLLPTLFATLDFHGLC